MREEGEGRGGQETERGGWGRESTREEEEEEGGAG